MYLRGGGDLASGVAVRLYRAGLQVLIVELPQPLVVRRTVAFAEAVYRGEWSVEGILSRHASNLADALQVLESGAIPVLVDPLAQCLPLLRAHLGVTAPLVLVDARMTKNPHDVSLDAVDLVIGLGPGFSAGVNCHAVVETMRGHRLGRVFWQGAPEPDTGVPEGMGGYQVERVLRSPAAGIFHSRAEIGDLVNVGQVLAEVSGYPILAPFAGVLRGLIHGGVQVQAGWKVGDVDPRGDPSFCRLVSDKALSIGGAVLEAILSRPALRPFLWDVDASKPGSTSA